MQTTHLRRRRRKPQIVIAGGGPAGWVAAVAAARNGARVLLAEQYGFLGGLATMGLVGPFMRYAAKEEQLIQGIFQEFCQRLARLGGLRHASFDQEKYKRVAQEMVLEAGVELLLHAYLIKAHVKDRTIKHITVMTKGGPLKLSGRIFIDATGDGDLAAMAGAPYEVGRPSDGLTQAMTLMFVVGGVDCERVEDHLVSHPEEYIHWPDEQTIAYNETGVLCRAGFFSAVRKAHEEGHLDRAIQHLFFISLPLEDMVVFNTTNVLQLNPLDPWDLSKAEIIARQQVWQIMRLLQKLPGFEKAYLIATAPHIGVRESRRILGEYVFTGDDVLQGRRFSDVIARGNYGIDIHDPEGKPSKVEYPPEQLSYDIPYRILVPREIENLLVAGRSVSSTHEGQSAIRIQPICMAMGEAAGTAAALCLKLNATPRSLNVGELQKQLRSQGANLGSPPHE
jgi:ribulose 1,5-bisphosphate synthetase/thiazole synthase